MKTLIIVSAFLTAMALSGCAGGDGYYNPAIGNAFLGAQQGFDRAQMYQPKPQTTICRPDYTGGTICNSY